MKRLFILIMTAVAAVSCLGDEGPTYSASYTAVSTFEYGNVCGSDSLYFENQIGLGMSWQDLFFYHKLNDAKTEFEGGFVVSCLKGSGRSDMDMFRVNKGIGYDRSMNYAVFVYDQDSSRMPARSMDFTASQIGTCKMVGCSVNNTAAVVEAVKNHFEPGDKLTLNLTGYLDGKETGTDVIVLAERTEQKDSIITDWKVCMFVKLGHVDYVDMKVVSTKPEVPTCVCIDDMQADISIEY